MDGNVPPALVSPMSRLSRAVRLIGANPSTGVLTVGYWAYFAGVTPKGNIHPSWMGEYVTSTRVPTGWR